MLPLSPVQGTCVVEEMRIAPTLTWIGWKFRINIGLIILPESKRAKLRHKLQHSDKCSRKSLEQFLGLAMWVIFRQMRSGLRVVYKDLYTLPASHYSINPEHWEQLLSSISDDLVFHSRPPGTAIPIGSKLLQVRHSTVKQKTDLLNCPYSDRRIWLRLIDPNTSKRKLSMHTNHVLKFFLPGYKWFLLLYQCGPSHSGRVCVLQMLLQQVHKQGSVVQFSFLLANADGLASL